MASKFYIMNEKAVRWPLNSPETGVFTAPSGFGIEYSSKYLQVGDLWLPNSRQLKQPTPSGKIVFPKNMYSVFQDFVNFLNSAKELILVYQPSGLDTEYFAEIDLVKIDKGGYNRSQFVVPIKFVCKSLFYTEEKFEYRIERAPREMRWDFRWETRFNDLNYVYFYFDNDGHVDAPYQLSFTGYCKNPSMQVIMDNQIIYELKFDLTLEKGDTLVLSTFDDDLYLEVNGVDRRECVDFTKDTFFKIPHGNSEIYFRAESGKMNNITMTFEKYYKGV